MRLKERFKELRSSYVIAQVRRANLPEFGPDTARRYKILFSGRVQKVGFRLEVCELAKKLGLTGFCQNLEDGSVVAECQGPENKIHYLISFMESLKRIKIRNKTIVELPLNVAERGFVQK